MNIFNLEIESALSDMLFLEREYKFFLSYGKFLNSSIPAIVTHAEERRIAIAKSLARGYNRMLNIYPVPARVWTEDNHKQSVARLIRKRNEISNAPWTK